MVDSLGYRMKFGVTNHFGRFHVTDAAVHDDEDYRRQREGVRANLLGAVDQLVTCEPGYLIVGIWAEAPGDGPDGAERMQKLIESRGGVGVAMSSTAARAALEAYGDGIRRLALAARDGLVGGDVFLLALHDFLVAALQTRLPLGRYCNWSK